MDESPGPAVPAWVLAAGGTDVPSRSWSPAS
jgi:hypothetical protein